PLSFEANQGQTDAQIDFLARGSAYTLFLTGGDAVLALRSPETAPPSRAGNDAQRLAAALPAGGGSPDTVLRLQLVGANPEPAPSGLETLPGKANYLIGNDPARWHTDIPTYAR